MGLWGAIKKSINSDLTTPLNTLMGTLQGTSNTISSNVNTINNSMGVKTLVCPTATTSSSSQPANVNVSSLPSLAQIVGLNVRSATGLVNNIASITINGINFAGSGGYPPTLKASDMPGVIETNSVSITSQQSSGGSFILTIYYRL